MKITVALMRNLEKQVNAGDISYSRMVEILNETLKPTEPATEKEPLKEVVSDETRLSIEKKADIYSDDWKNEKEKFAAMSGFIAGYTYHLSPVSQTTEEKLKSIISDKPSNWYEKALERKVKKLEAELSQTKGLDITDEEIDNVIFKIHEISLEVNSFVCGLPVGHPEAMLKIKSELHSLLSQSKQKTETNK